MKVYLVSSGSYSDYRIEAAFSTEEKAKAYTILDDERNIEEIELDEAETVEYVCIKIQPYKKSYIYEFHEYSNNYPDHGVVEVIYCDNPYGYDVKVKVQNNRDAMIKSAYDKIAEYKATKAGIS